MCVSACPQKTPNLRGGFRERRLTDTPDATALPMAGSHHFTHPHQVSARLAPPVMMCCSARPASSSAPSVLRTRGSVLVVNIKHIRRLCDLTIILHIFDQTCIVLKSGWSSTMGPPYRQSSSPVSVSTPDATAKPMASSHHFTPPSQISARSPPLV